MASKKVEFHEDAALEYEAAFEWYMERSILAASKFAESLNRAIDMIAEAPQRWLASSNGIRRFLLQKFPFAIVYRELPAVIQVVAIAPPGENPVIGNNASDTRAMFG